VLLHFGAVDYEATVYVNGQKLGTHTGGYQSFTFDITDALKRGDNTLIVKVYDPTETGPNPHGKQTLHQELAFYSPSSGIWQSVWLERVPSTYIDTLKFTPDVDRSELRLEVVLLGKPEGYTLDAIVRSGSKIVARQGQGVRGPTALHIDQPRLWSPDDPYLYDLEVHLLKDGQVVDTVTSYFGLRKIEVKKDAQGMPRIYLNNYYTYNLGVADQGFWPEGLYTAPTDAALKFDLQAIKALGFNSVRKHIKIEPQRWYTYCDRLGLLVWQDMPSSNNDSPQARAEFEKELKENLSQLHNHPSITTWVLFNEGWGAYDEERLARWMKQADPSRLLNGHSGPFDQIKIAQWLKHLDPSRLPGSLGGDSTGLLDEVQNMQFSATTIWPTGDVADLHFYPGPKMPPVRGDMARVTGENGSFGVFIEGHVWDELGPVGLGVGGSGMTPPQMLKAYGDSIEQLRKLEAQGLSGSNYFEIFDVEAEQQGFITYDRDIAKVPIAEVARLNGTLVSRAKNYAAATAGFSVRDVDATPESQRYAALVEEYKKGKQDLPFLRRLALMALRQKDQGQASEVGNTFIARSARPYSKETWAVIAAITRTSKDKGFELLRMHTEEANAMLGVQVAQKKVLEVIAREWIEPYFKDKTRTPDWFALEKSLTAQYGPLGREVVCGGRMMDALLKEDWNTFGDSYARYFESALPRSPYPLHNLSYQVLEHVSEPKTLEAAARVMRWSVDTEKEFPVFGRYDPTELDTYANLLYKLGRQGEALEWQHRAVVLSDARDPEITEHWETMQAGADRGP
jgi:hypothetical protein